MQGVVRQIEQVAESGFSVLVQGETGTGKELVSRAIHEESLNRDQPFVAVDCGTLPDNLMESELFGHERGAFTGADRRKDGRFVLAERGTIFLDEVGNLPVAIQPKLLRVIQERQVIPLGSSTSRAIEARFVVATNSPLEAAVKAGTFRQDLYYRLAEFTIVVPPLRERREDIPLLAARFRQQASVELRRGVGGIEPVAIELLQEYPWPGNVRELRNVIRRAVLVSENYNIGADELRQLLRNGESRAVAETEAATSMGTLREIAERAVEDAERQAIQSVLKKTRGNKSQAARLLCIDFKTLHVKMKRYGMTSGAH